MKKHILTLTALIAGTAMYGATVPIEDYSSNEVITQEEFAAAQNAAGNGGIITFQGRELYTTKEKLELIKSNITIVGNDRTTSDITYVGGGRITAMFTTDQDGFKVQALTIGGETYPTFLDDKPLDLNEGARCDTGVEAAVHVKNGALNMKAVGARFEKVNVGIEYETSTFPDGLEVTNTQFKTGRGMINAHDSTAEEESGIGYQLKRPMKIDNADFYYYRGQGARGITLDFGNGHVTSMINFKGSVVTEKSYIKNSYINNTTNFNIDANHLKSLDIRDSVFRGGGAGVIRTNFCNALHFEDTCDDILIQGNEIHQREENDAGVELTAISQIWSGGDNGLVENMRVISNTMTGKVTKGSLSGYIASWKVTWNKFNLDEFSPYIIHGWNNSYDLDQHDNTVNGDPLKDSEINLIP